MSGSDVAIAGWGRSVRVAVVDSDGDMAQHVADALSRRKYEVVRIDPGEDVLERLIEVQPDMAILDVMIPGDPLYGLGLIRAIRRTQSIHGLLIVLHSSVGEACPACLSTADLEYGWFSVQAIIEKQGDVSELARTVGRLAGAA
jgi:CheY-like chemotaxis protein